MTREHKDTFWQALTQNNLPAAKEMLLQFPDFARIDLRPEQKQDHFSNGFALHEACKQGHYEIAELLLKQGADPDAKGSNDQEQPEFGTPICYAVEQKNYPLAHLLLDNGASVFAFPYCDTPMIETLYHQARVAGLKPSTIRKGYSKYMGETELEPTKADSPDAIKLFLRVLESGGEPNLSAIVRDEYLELIEELLKTCPEKPAPKLAYPQGSVFGVLVDRASWYGYPEILKMCMDICPQLFTVNVSRLAIYNGLISHNRDGRIDDYMALLTTQLEYLKSLGKLNGLKTEIPIYPFYLLAEHFCWHNNYGFKAPLSTGEDIVRVAKLFMEYGFDDYHKIHPKDKLTPIEKAQSRLQHQGIPDYVKFLKKL